MRRDSSIGFKMVVFHPYLPKFLIVSLSSALSIWSCVATSTTLHRICSTFYSVMILIWFPRHLVPYAVMTITYGASSLKAEDSRKI